MPHHPDTHVTVVEGTPRPQRDGVAGHLAGSPVESVTLRGLPVTTPCQTFVDLSRDLDLVDLVVLGDSLVGRGLATPDDLVVVAASCGGRRARRARQGAALVRQRVESPMETRARLMIVFAGLPEPLVKRHDPRTGAVLSGRPQLPRRPAGHRGRRQAARRVLASVGSRLDRREDLDRWGWRLIVLRSADVYVDPRAAIDRIVEAMGAVGMAVPRVLTRERLDRHFPGRAWETS